jgi:2-oxoglutarate dehydrogenase E2 component (dihydrolipoamide succinyltransferase)
MAVEIKVPELGESITEIQIAEWLVKEGDTVARDQNLVSVDSEKATVEIPAPAGGRLGKILKPNGAAAKVGEVIGEIETDGAQKTESPKREQPKPEAKPKDLARDTAKKPEPGVKEEEEAARPEKVSPPAAPAKKETSVTTAAEHLVEEHEAKTEKVEAPRKSEPPISKSAQPEIETKRGDSEIGAPGRDEVQRMTPLRRTVAKRLVEAQQTMAILTTFNEVDMSAVIALRKQFQEAFQARHGVKLGFMSFFVKAVIEALKIVPQLNAEIRGNEIVFHRYYDIAVAIGAGKGLVVPPLRNAERMSFAGIEKNIADLAACAKDNKLKPEELEGGTFTISNGGVYGSMLSTPIINPPQSGILGLHAIQERPVAREGQVVIRPMMFVALSYDHRIVDGREAVTFLRRVKEIIEDPARMMLEI